MRLLRKIRFSLAAVMMLVVMAASTAALFVKVRSRTLNTIEIDAPVLFTLSVLLTATALGALKGHSAVQTMLQATLACLGFLSLVSLGEQDHERPLRYWFVVSFGLLVTLPLLARSIVKTQMDRGPRRDWWKKTFEAVIFSFLTMMLVLLGIVLWYIADDITTGYFRYYSPRPSSTVPIITPGPSPTDPSDPTSVLGGGSR
jgi:hypothetical protein